MDTIEYTKKEYVTQSTGKLEDFIGFKIKRDVTKTTLNISQLHLITKKNQRFNEDVK